MTYLSIINYFKICYYFFCSHKFFGVLYNFHKLEVTIATPILMI